VSKIARRSNASVTLDIYAEEFDKAMHRDDQSNANGPKRVAHLREQQIEFVGAQTARLAQ
jgi:hypothetical protein